MHDRAAGLIAALADRGETVATAESLTGGLVAATLTAVPGASAVFRGGVVSYATDLKASLAGVPEAVLRRAGPVAAETAAAMAEGVRRSCGSTYGVATTGVAGPDPQDGRPPGTLHVAVATPGDTLVASSGDLAGDRAAVRTAAVDRALRLLQEAVRDGGESHRTTAR